MGGGKVRHVTDTGAPNAETPVATPARATFEGAPLLDPVSIRAVVIPQDMDALNWVGN